MPRTTKRCPGCGESPNQGGRAHLWRESTEVCPECKTLLQMGKRLRDSKQSNDRRKLFSLPPAGFEHLVSRWHAGLGRSGRFDGSKREELLGQLLELIYALGEEGLPDEYTSTELLLFESQFTTGVPYRFDAKVAELLRSIYFGIRDSLREAYDFGVKDGHSILHELAAGNLSIQEFNEKTFEKE